VKPWSNRNRPVGSVAPDVVGDRQVQAPAMKAAPAPRRPGTGREPLYEIGPLRLRLCRHGPMVYLTTDRYVGRSLDLYGEFAGAEVDLLSSLVGPGSWVLDVGANVGSHAIPLAHAVGEHGRVLAFEPQPLLFQFLCANAALCGARAVRPRRLAVGAVEGRLTAPPIDPDEEDNHAGHPLRAGGPGEEVRVIPLDSLVLDLCDLIKVDVEGMEADVLTGAEATIRRLRPVLYVENDREDRSAALIRQLWSLGYRLWWHLAPLYRPDNFAANAENVFGGVVSGNLLCLPAERHTEPVGLPAVVEQGETWRTAVTRAFFPRAAS